MDKTQTLEAFYKEKLNYSPKSPGEDLMQFNILSNEDCKNGATMSYRRRDFYKVSFFTGRSIIHYGNKSLEVDGTAIVFFNPDVPYTVEIMDERMVGGFFIFREAYFNDHYRTNIRDLPIFSSGIKPVFLLDKSQAKTVDKIFKRTQKELASNYEFKHDLIRNQIVELIHFALKLQPSEKLYQQIDAKVRITTVFNELLERQFPIESTKDEFGLRSASDFADQLGVHVNYLNRAIKSTTGKTTTEQISQRLTREAIALLKHSHWNISEISYSLGFEDPSHFNHFFKKQTNQVPSSFRAS
jgi:AraC family transcriptional regulator, transcriptional activator of pobA